MKCLTLGLAFFLLICCSPKLQAEKDWWEHGVFYQIYPRSFKDSNGDGVGDIKGIIQKLDHLVDLGVDGVWLSPVFKSPMADFGYDISDFKLVDPVFGTNDDLAELVKLANAKGIKIILDFVPNHTSDEHEWFQKSIKNETGYREYYIWKDGKNNGSAEVNPNNWQSVFHTDAWTKDNKQFYYHQFDKKQPDLNYRNPVVQKEMEDVVRFWLDRGISGFRIDAINHMFEDENLKDEVKIDPNGPLLWENLYHNYTQNLPESYEIIYDWRKVFESYQNGASRIMMTEAYADLEQTMLWYQNADGSKKGSHIPFNFAMIINLNNESKAIDFKNTIDEWLNNMPKGANPNWVLGNHDRPRISSRFGNERADTFAIMEMTLPGIAVVYYGEEIGMVDNRDISWKDTQDPQACNTNETVYQEYTRDPVRTPMQWDKTINSGFSNATKTWLPVNPNYKDLNLESQKDQSKSLYKLYKNLIKLRKEPAFDVGNFTSNVYGDEVFAFSRVHHNESYVVVINISQKNVSINLKNLIQSEKLEVVISSLNYEHSVRQKLDTEAISIAKFDAVVFKGVSGASVIRICSYLILLCLILNLKRFQSLV